MAINLCSTKSNQKYAGAVSVHPYFCDTAAETMGLARLTLDFGASCPFPGVANHAAFRRATQGLLDLIR